ncbi:hypothetical protein C0580_00010 [Candidatus Parcubacteria bacterium]|nr:MAG: hypothetical protein C0580_00010 [Candidatus Parcubacteria bacterium]
MKKNILIIAAVVLIIFLTQLLGVNLVKYEKITGGTGQWFAKTYGLKAATIYDGDEVIDVPMKDYLEVRDFIANFKDPDIQGFDGQADLAWDRLLRNVWLNQLAEEKDLFVTDEEMESYINYYIPDLEEFKQNTQEEFGVSYDDYKKFVIEPTALELKVYNYLLVNYNDIEGVSKAQGAYDALSAGQDFEEVGAIFSDDMTLVEGSVYLTEEQLVGFYEPIKELSVGEFSKIVQIPMPPGYALWYVTDELEEEGEQLKEVKAIFVNAASVDDFFNAYLDKVEIKKHQ